MDERRPDDPRPGALRAPQPVRGRVSKGPVRPGVVPQRPHLLRLRDPRPRRRATRRPPRPERPAVARPCREPDRDAARAALRRAADLRPSQRRSLVVSESATRVLVVDDSAVVRQTLLALLSETGDFQVEVAANPFVALRHLGERRPDVIVLDLEMPKMDGLTFLRKIMAED